MKKNIRLVITKDGNKATHDYFPFAKNKREKLILKGYPTHPFSSITIGNKKLIEGRTKAVEGIYYFILKFVQINMDKLPDELVIPECLIKSL